MADALADDPPHTRALPGPSPAALAPSSPRRTTLCFQWELDPEQRPLVADGSGLFPPVRLEFHPDDRDDALAAARASRAAGRPYEGIHRLRDIRGDFRWFEFLGDRPPPRDEGTLRGVIRQCSGPDDRQARENRKADEAVQGMLDETRRRLDQQKQTIGEIEVARDKAVRAAHAKAQFLATMSHEIRTPLNGVIGMTDLLLDSELSAEQRDHAEVLRLAADSLLSVINDILDFSKIEAGKMSLESETFDPTRTVREAMDLLGVRAAEKKLALTCSIESDGPIFALGDAPRLRQVLVNLIGNAVKFTQEGSVDVRATVIADDDGGVLAQFEVCDTGVGIAPDELPKLFEEFTQVGGATRGQSEGTGLGLAISRKLVTLMGGQIGASSTLGEGSRFWVTLPLAAPKDSSRAPAEAPERPLYQRLACEPPRILVAEDNPVNQRLIHAQLARLGCTADVVGDGQAAVRAALAQEYDVVLMDCRMPRLNGFEATAQIRQEEGARRHTWIVAMTASAMEGDREHCLAAGMDDYVAKPIQLDDLAPALERSLDRRAAETDDQNSRAAESVGEACEAPIRAEVLAALRAEFAESDDLDEFHQILEVYVRSARRNFEAAREALARTDMPALGLAAHSLKGSSGSIGANRLCTLSGRLEALADGAGGPDARELLEELRRELGRVECALHESTI